MTRERKDKSCARVEQYTTGTVGNIERHNERKNGDYGNVNVVPERIPLNIHFKSPGDQSYMQYQIKKDTERLKDIENRLKAEEVRYEVNHNIFKMHSEIDGMGKKTLLGSVTVSKDDFKTLTDLAKEGIYSRTVINDNEKIIERIQDRYYRLSEAYDRLYERYE